MVQYAREGSAKLIEFSPEELIDIREMLDEQMAAARITYRVSDAEFRHIITVAEARGLDPRLKQIYVIPYKNRSSGRTIPSIVVGIEGLRIIAARTGLYVGQRGPFYAGRDREWYDMWVGPASEVIACKVGVIRKGDDVGTFDVAHMVEYSKSDDSGANLWKSIPLTMIAKVAEGRALRRAFPAETAGLTISGDRLGDNDVVVADEEIATRTDAPIDESAPKLTAKEKREADILGRWCEFVDGIYGEVPGSEITERIAGLSAENKKKAKEYYFARLDHLHDEAQRSVGGSINNEQGGEPEEAHNQSEQAENEDEDANAEQREQEIEAKRARR